MKWRVTREIREVFENVEAETEQEAVDRVANGEIEESVDLGDVYEAEQESE